MKGKDVRESIGLVLVVASLVFVGWEIRQNTALARGQARQELAALNQEWLVLQATDPDFSELFARAWSRDAGLTETEARQARYAMRVNLRRLENVYFQYSEGLVDMSALNSYGLQASNWYSTTQFRDFWVERNERDAYDPGFVAFFESQVGIIR